MLTNDLRDNLRKLPWRGHVIPVEADAPESKLPELRGVSRTKVFTLNDTEECDQYNEVLNRIQQGLARSLASELATTSDGEFRALLVWEELYMCAPDYSPAEGRPALQSNKSPDPVFSHDDRDGSLRDDIEDFIESQGMFEDGRMEGNDEPETVEEEPEAPSQPSLSYEECGDRVMSPDEPAQPPEGQVEEEEPEVQCEAPEDKG